jgi:hypothetical protein
MAKYTYRSSITPLPASTLALQNTQKHSRGCCEGGCCSPYTQLYRCSRRDEMLIGLDFLMGKSLDLGCVAGGPRFVSFQIYYSTAFCRRKGSVGVTSGLKAG